MGVSKMRQLNSRQNEQLGLYRSEFEHDACGLGALTQLDGLKSHQMLDDALSVLINLEHRGGVGLERNTGDGAGVLFQVPHRFFRKEAQTVMTRSLCGITRQSVQAKLCPTSSQLSSTQKIWMA